MYRFIPGTASLGVTTQLTGTSTPIFYFRYGMCVCVCVHFIWVCMHTDKVKHPHDQQPLNFSPNGAKAAIDCVSAFAIVRVANTHSLREPFQNSMVNFVL